MLLFGELAETRMDQACRHQSIAVRSRGQGKARERITQLRRVVSTKV